MHMYIKSFTNRTINTLFPTFRNNPHYNLNQKWPHHSLNQPTYVVLNFGIAFYTTLCLLTTPLNCNQVALSVMGKVRFIESCHVHMHTTCYV